MHSTSSTYVLASQQEATHVTVRLDVLRLSLPDATAASLYLVFTGDPAPQSLQRVGELLLPRVRLHLDAEVTGADEYASHVFTDISSALGSRVQLDALALCVVGMLLRLEFLLLYVAFTQPSYLRSLVCESLYVLCSAALSGSASLQEPDSALGFLVLHGSHGVHDSDDGMVAWNGVTNAQLPKLCDVVTSSAGSGPPPTDDKMGKSVSFCGVNNDGVDDGMVALHGVTNAQLPKLCDVGASSAGSSPPPLPMGAPGALVPQGITASSLAAASPEQQKQLLGERLFPLISVTEPQLAGKITGVLLDMDNGELLDLLASPEALSAKVMEAISVLRTYASDPVLQPGDEAAKQRVASEVPAGGAAGLHDPAPWADEAFVKAVVTPLRSSAYKKGAKGAAMTRELTRVVRDAISASSPVVPALECADHLRLCLSQLRGAARVDGACADEVCEHLRAQLLMRGAAASSLPPPLPVPPAPDRMFFVGGGKARNAEGNCGPVGSHSTPTDHRAVDSASRSTDLVQGEQLGTNAKAFLVLTERAKMAWIQDYAEESVPVTFGSGNSASAYSGRARRTVSIKWKGVAYPTRTLGVWRRIFCMWRARITGWFTAAEMVMYYSLINKIERSDEGARELLRALVHRTRYVNGRLPGCSRYSEMPIKYRYAWRARLGYCEHTQGRRAYGYPLEYYGFTASCHAHGSILRLHSIPIWCYVRHKSEARCMFSLRETATDAHRSAQQVRVEERVLYFCLYCEGFALKYGPPVQLHKGCLPGAFTKGVSQAGLEVAGIDISSKSADFCREFRPGNSRTRVTFTLGDGLDDRVVELALSKHPGLVHTGTFVAFACQPHTSVRQLVAEQGLDASERVLNSALGVDRRAYRLHGIPWMNESVGGSVASVHPSVKRVLINGFLTGEQSVDKHVIYYEDLCPPLLDEELLEHAAWIANHSCGGMLRPFQHLGPDGVPTYMGERDPSDPSKYVHYVKPGGGWVNRRPWACCKGSAWVVFGNMPPGVTHADWCAATGNSATHIRDTQQLRNALWPRLGSLLGPQIHMYWMAGKYGFPVIAFPDARRDPRLLAWLRSILFCQGPWPRMPFQHYRLVLTPVSSPGTIVVTQCGHMLGVFVASRTSTLLDDLVTGLAQSFPQYSPDKKDLRFAGMLTLFSPRHLVFCSEVLDDDALASIPETPVASFASAPYDPTARATLVSVSISEYLVFLNEQALLGRYEWGIDLVILRSHLGSELAASQSLVVDASADAGAAAHVCVSPSRYVTVPSKSRAARLDYVYQSRVIAATMATGVVGASTQSRPTFNAHSIRVTRSQAAHSQLSFEEQLDHLCPLVSPMEWSPHRSVVNADGLVTKVPCAVRVLTRALAREIMPELVPDDDAAPKVVLPQDHLYDTRFAPWAERYKAAALRLGIVYNLAPPSGSEEQPQIVRFGVADVVWNLPVYGEQVLLTSLGRRLVPFSARVSRLARNALHSAKAARAAMLRPFYGRIWVRDATPPVLPVPYSELYRHWVTNRGRQQVGTPGPRIHKHSFIQWAEGQLRRAPLGPATQRILVTSGQLHKFRLQSVGPEHHVLLTAPSTARSQRATELIFTAHLRPQDMNHPRLPVVRGLQPWGDGLLASVSSWISCRASLSLQSSAFRHVIDWMIEHGESVLRCNSLSWYDHALVMDCLFGRRLHTPTDTRARTLERYLHHGIEKASAQNPTSITTVSIRTDQSGYDIRYRAYMLPVPRPFISSARAVPLSSDGSVQRRSLVDGTLYLCPLPLLVQHMERTGRKNLSGLVSVVHKAAASRVAAAAESRVAAASLAVVPVEASGAFMRALRTLLGAWVSVGDMHAGICLSRCTRFVASECRAVWATHMDYSRVPHVDLACDYRVMAALHAGTKIVETRFLRGALNQVRPGFLCKTWCPRPSVAAPASKFPCWGYIMGVVYDRGFQRLYERFGARILPGMPRDYIADLPTRASSSPGNWHPSEVEQVYMSIYRSQHPTVESWRASQRGGARNVVAFILAPLPPGFTVPQGPPVNPRRQVLMDETRWTSDERVQHASAVVQSYARRYLRRPPYLTRLRAFRAMVSHVALLSGRDLAVPHSLHAVYSSSLVWARHARPRFVGYAASLRLQVRWRAWLGPSSSPVAVVPAVGHKLVGRPVELGLCTSEVARSTSDGVDEFAASWIHGVVNRVVAAVDLADEEYSLAMSRVAASWVQDIVRRVVLFQSLSEERRALRMRRLTFKWRAVGLMLCAFHASHRRLLKSTRTGRSYLCIRGMAVQQAEVPDTRLVVFPGTPKFRIDDLVSCASASLALDGLAGRGTSRRVHPVPRDGACLIHAFAVAIRIWDTSSVRRQVAEWLTSRMLGDSDFTLGVAASVVANVSPLSPASTLVYNTAEEVSSHSTGAQAFIDAYSAHLLLEDTYCGEYEIMALASIWRVRIDVLRVTSSAHDTLEGASLVTWFSVAHEAAHNDAPVTLLYTNQHYDAVVRLNGWRILRSVWILTRLFVSSRRRLASRGPAAPQSHITRSSQQLALAATSQAAQTDSSFVGGGRQVVREPLESSQERRANWKAQRALTAPSRASVQAKEQHQLERALQVSATAQEGKDLEDALHTSVVEHEQTQDLRRTSAATLVQLSFRDFVSRRYAAVRKIQSYFIRSRAAQEERHMVYALQASAKERDQVFEGKRHSAAVLIQLCFRSFMQQGTTEPEATHSSNTDALLGAADVNPPASNDGLRERLDDMNQRYAAACKIQACFVRARVVKEARHSARALRTSSEEQEQMRRDRMHRAAALVQHHFRGLATVRHRAACRIQLGFLSFFAQRCRQQRVKDPESQAAEAMPAASRTRGSKRVYTYRAQDLQIEELFCDACGKGGVIDDDGLCESCLQTPHSSPRSATALAYLTYRATAPRS